MPGFYLLLAGVLRAYGFSTHTIQRLHSVPHVVFFRPPLALF